MSSKTIASLVVLGLLGIGAALGIGLAANAISGDTIGLSAEPLRAGDRLSPEARTTTTNTTPTTTTTTTPTTTTEPGDDSSGSGSDDSGRGRGRGRGRGEDD